MTTTSRRILVAIMTIALALVLLPNQPAYGALIGQPTNVDSANQLTKGSTVVAINAGGPQFTDKSGQVWSADKNFIAGTGGTSSTTHAISGTDDQPLFQTQRWGATGYDIPIPNGNYDLELLFAETAPQVPLRVFDVVANDVTLLKNFNITATVGQFAADTETFPVTISGGMLSLRFPPTANKMTLAGIQVTNLSQPACSTDAPQLNINSGGGAVTAPDGGKWTADQFFTNGNPGGTATTTQTVTGTDNQAVFQSERWGIAAYDIPFQNGTWDVALNFAEINPQSGTRIFDVGLQGKTVLQNFNIAADVGPFRADIKTFPAVVTDGFIHVNFTRIQNAPAIVGIQVLTHGEPNTCVGQAVKRINTGGHATTDVQGNIWLGDQDSIGGGGQISVTNHTIADTPDQNLYTSARVGVNGYDIPLDNGNYNINLGFVELQPELGPRTFDIGLQGQTVATNYSPGAVAGNFTYTNKIFPVVVTDGVVHLRFKATQGASTISTIQLTTTLNAPVNSQWKLSLGDDFEGTSVDTSKWGIYAGSGNEGVGIRDPANATVHDGELDLAGTKAYNGSGVAMKLNQTFGRVVVRAKVDKGNGYGPAILMWPQSERWPQDGEIDMSEIPQGARTQSYFTLHWGTNNSQESTTSTGDFSGWHTWTLEWATDHISEWIDDPTFKTTANAPAIPKGPMHLALQQDVGAAGHWIPPADANTPPKVSLHIASASVFQNNTTAVANDSKPVTASAPPAGTSYLVSGPILAKQQQVGGQAVTGVATTPQEQLAPRVGEAGSFQSFQNGKIFTSLATGTRYIPNGQLQNAFFNRCAFFCYDLPTSGVLQLPNSIQELQTQRANLFAPNGATNIDQVTPFNPRP